MTHDMDVYATAKFLSYHPQTVRDLAREGKLPALKRGRAWFFNQQELETWLRESTEAHVATSPQREKDSDSDDPIRKFE